MRKILLAFVIASVIYLEMQPLYPVYAADATPSALQSKLKALQEEIASRAASLKKEINNKLQNKVYIGKISEKNSDSLKLATSQGEREVMINEFTEYFDDKDKKLTVKNISLENSIAALGDINDKEILTAKRIIKLASTSAEEKKIFGGTVSSIDPQTLTLKTIEGQASLTLSAQTNYQFGDQEALRSDIKLGKQVVVVSVNNKSRFVYMVPSAESSPLPKPSPSASASASPKASVKPSPSPKK